MRDVQFAEHIQIRGLFWSAHEGSHRIGSMPKPNKSGRRPRPKPPFAGILVKLMQEKGIGVREAARAAGVGPSTISSWRSGAVPEDLLAVKRLAERLGVSLSFLLTGEDETRPKDQPPALCEVLDDGRLIFDGIARVTIRELVRRPSGESGE